MHNSSVSLPIMRYSFTLGERLRIRLDRTRFQLHQFWRAINGLEKITTPSILPDSDTEWNDLERANRMKEDAHTIIEFWMLIWFFGLIITVFVGLVVSFGF